MKAYSLGALALLACTGGPTTGETYSGPTNGAVLPFFGWTDTQSVPVTAYAMSDPYGDPADPTEPWTAIGTTFTQSSPSPGMNDPSKPAYYWSMSTTPISGALWKAGGLLRMKVKSKYNSSSTPQDLTSFDDSGLACANAQVQAGEKWWVAGQNCQSPYPDAEIITMTSTTPRPADLHLGDVRYLAKRGGVSPDHCTPETAPNAKVAQTNAYYAGIGAPGTLAQFKLTYGFHDEIANPVRAVYYNAGDLGIAREMNCNVKPIAGGQITACYVSNYARSTTFPHGPVGFGPDNLAPQTALAQAIAGASQPSGANRPVATVAMIHDSTWPADRRVGFMVYDAAGALTPLAPLDNAGVLAAANPALPSNANINVPGNCLTCHGPSSTYPGPDRGPKVYNARFLPFDPDQYLYSDTNPQFSRDALLPKLKELNKLVWDTQPAPATLEMLAGMYPSGSGLGPKDPLSQFDPNWLPDGWDLGTSSSRAAKNVYTKVVKPYCRTCHVAHDYLDWNTYQEFADAATSIGQVVCNQNATVPMPQAEQVQSRMWQSGARAHLMAAFGLTGACTPIEADPEQSACP